MNALIVVAILIAVLVALLLVGICAFLRCTSLNTEDPQDNEDANDMRTRMLQEQKDNPEHAGKIALQRRLESQLDEMLEMTKEMQAVQKQLRDEYEERVYQRVLLGEDADTVDLPQRQRELRKRIKDLKADIQAEEQKHKEHVKQQRVQDIKERDQIIKEQAARSGTTGGGFVAELLPAQQLYAELFEKRRAPGAEHHRHDHHTDDGTASNVSGTMRSADHMSSAAAMAAAVPVAPLPSDTDALVGKTGLTDRQVRSRDALERLREQRREHEERRAAAAAEAAVASAAAPRDVGGTPRRRVGARRQRAELMGSGVGDYRKQRAAPLLPVLQVQSVVPEDHVHHHDETAAFVMGAASPSDRRPVDDEAPGPGGAGTPPPRAAASPPGRHRAFAPALSHLPSHLSARSAAGSAAPSHYARSDLSAARPQSHYARSDFSRAPSVAPSDYAPSRAPSVAPSDYAPSRSPPRQSAGGDSGGRGRR